MPAPQPAYVLGTQGTHTCGDNIVLESEAACQAASAQLGHDRSDRRKPQEKEITTAFG